MPNRLNIRSEKILEVLRRLGPSASLGAVNTELSGCGFKPVSNDETLYHHCRRASNGYVMSVPTLSKEQAGDTAYTA